MSYYFISLLSFTDKSNYQVQIYVSHAGILINIFRLGGSSQIIKRPAMQDDPQKRKPDITLAKGQLNWSPKVS